MLAPSLCAVVEPIASLSFFYDNCTGKCMILPYFFKEEKLLRDSCHHTTLEYVDEIRSRYYASPFSKITSRHCLQGLIDVGSGGQSLNVGAIQHNPQKVFWVFVLVTQVSALVT